MTNFPFSLRILKVLKIVNLDICFNRFHFLFLIINVFQTKGDNWQCSLCDKIGMVGGESLNESEWVKEVQRRRAIKQREMFGKALKCLPVCSYQNDEPMIDEEEAATMDITVQSDLEINTRSCNSSQVLSPAIVLPDQRDNADKSLFSNQRTNTGVGADERSAISLERIESASTNQNKVTSGAHVGVGNAIETPFEMNRSNSDRLPESESVTLFGDRNQRVRTSGVSIVQSGSFGQIISTEQNCDISASSVSVEQIEIGSSVEIGQLADSNEFDTQSSSNLVVVGQDQSSVNSVQRSPFTSNENTCDDLLSQSSSERFPIINGSCRPADEHPYACSQRHAVTISTSATSTTITINTSSANSISGSGSSASIKSTSTNSSKRGELLQRSDSIRTTERPKQRSRQEIMNHYFCRNNGTELLKQKLFRK